MGEGTEAVGKKLGAKRIPVVKGQSLSGYEPRNAQVIGVTYAKSPMGADHTTGAMPMGNGDTMSKVMRITMSGRLTSIWLLPTILCVCTGSCLFRRPDYSSRTDSRSIRRRLDL